MKNIKILLILIATAVLFGSCVKEEFPQNGVVTADQAKESLEASTAGLHAWMNKFNVLGELPNEEWHWDWGYGALIMMRELMGQDLVQFNGYDNWRFWRSVLSLTPDTVLTAMPWKWYYRFVLATNAIIGAVPDYEAASDPDRWSVGIAYTYRAMIYFDLARLYLQGNYIDNPNGATVPIVLDTTDMDAARNNPRASAADVYELILGDLTKAEECLQDYSRSDAVMPDLSVVEGLLARVYLEMGDWPKAAQYAASAQGGYDPLSEAEWTDRANGFNNPYSNNSWMWGFSITNNDELVQTGILCWTPNMSNEAADFGYTYYNYVMIDAHLYNLIGENDFRKKSYVDPSYTDPESENPVIPDSSNPYILGFFPEYTSLKFRPGNGEFYNYVTANSTSVPLMRVEEMMLIEIEAIGRGNVSAGVEALNNFVQSNRDPDYESTATSLDEFIEDLWIQRRIEFWGEGISAFDLKRLNKGITRSYAGTNQIKGSRYNTTEQPYWLDFVIPRNEINANDGISPEQNNPTPDTPVESQEHVW